MKTNEIKEIVMSLYLETASERFINSNTAYIRDFAERCCSRVLEIERGKRIDNDRKKNNYRSANTCKYCINCSEDEKLNLTCWLDKAATYKEAVCDRFEQSANCK